ncbi:MAG TPA: polysaccharide biosynthesis C-terminal domain-containing protein [Polyangiaceae bacterium]|jgi:O-antigen/teichoic acid export membrane protein|nr:polysaccharide biosynthesis C-terminal domain-containing protein [Polyangiaceae bacterium]
MTAPVDPAALAAPATRAGRGALARIGRNTASMLVGDGAGEVLVGYSLGLAALALGPRGFGRLAEAQAFMDPFDALAGLGLASIAMVVAARRKGVDGAMQGTILGLRALSGAATACLALGAAFATGRGDLFPLLSLVAIIMVVVPVSIASTLPFRHEQTLHRRMVVPFLAAVVRLGAAYLAYFFLRRPFGFQLAVLAGSITAALLDYRFARRSYPERPRFDWALAKELVVLGWPAAVFEVIIMVYTRASYFLLRSVGPVAQGEYAAADRLVRPLLAVAGALFVSALPALAALAEERQFVRLRLAYEKAVLRITLVMVPVATTAWFLAPFLLRRFAPEYAAAVWPFRVLLVGTLFMFLNISSTAFALALGRFRGVMIIALADLAVYFGLAARLVPRHGALGAAFSTSIMESVNTVMQMSFVFYVLRDSARAGPAVPPRSVS